jgi:hypothetical protein
LTLSVRADGVPEVRLADKEGKGRIGLTLNSDGSPSVSLHGPDGTARVEIACDEANGIANISLHNRKGDRRVGLSAFPAREASLGFSVDRDGQKGGLSVGIHEDGTPVVEVCGSDADGNRRVTLGPLPAGAVGVAVHNEKGEPSVQVGLKRDGKFVLDYPDEGANE